MPVGSCTEDFTPQGNTVVIHAIDRDQNTAYERRSGSLLHNGIEKVFRDLLEKPDPGYRLCTLFLNLYRYVKAEATSHGVKQIPTISYYGPEAHALPLSVFLKGCHVLLIVPDYDPHVKLSGARKDVIDFYDIFSKHFSNSELTIMVKNAQELLSSEALKECKVISSVTQKAVFEAVKEHMQHDRAVIYLAGHGKPVVVDGYPDQVFVVPTETPDPENDLTGQAIAELIAEKPPGTACLLICDFCYSNGVPDKKDFKRALEKINAKKSDSLEGENGIGVPEDDLVGRGLATDVISGIQSAIGFFQMLLNGTETIGHTVMGSGLTAMVGIGAVLLVTFMMACTAFVYWRQAMANRKGTLFSMLVFGALSAMLPYMCDARMLQTFVSVENSMYLGTVGALLAILVIVLHNAADWTKITKAGQKFSMLSHVAAKATLLSSIAVQMHVMGWGNSVPQSMRIQMNDGSKYVMYMPLNYSAVKGHPVCVFLCNTTTLETIELFNDSGYTARHTRLSDGSFADITCQYPAFQQMVAESARNNPRHLMEWSFNHGEFVVNLREINTEVTELQHLTRLIDVDNSTWPDDPLLSRLQDVWELQTDFETGISPPTLKSQPELPWVHMFAAPLIKLIEHLAGISLWPLWLLKQ